MTLLHPFTVCTCAPLQVTQYQLQKQKEFEEKIKEEQMQEAGMEKRREVSEESYSRMVETVAQNRADSSAATATNVTEALSVLGA